MLVPEHRDAEKEHAEQTGEDRQRARGVARLGRLECRDTVGDCLHAGHRRAATREGTEHQEEAHSLGRARQRVQMLGRIAGRDAERRPREQRSEREHEDVRRDDERSPGLANTAKVDDHEHDDRHDVDDARDSG